MKKLVTFALMTISLSGFAYDTDPSYYATEVRVVSVRPMCPRNIPSGAVCMGLGSIVTLETTLDGCLDKLVFSEFEERSGRGVVEIHAISIAKRDPKSLVAYCVRANKVRKTITVNYPGQIKLINQRVEQ